MATLVAATSLATVAVPLQLAGGPAATPVQTVVVSDPPLESAPGSAACTAAGVDAFPKTPNAFVAARFVNLPVAAVVAPIETLSMEPLVALRLVNEPAAGVVAPIETPLMEPPVALRVVNEPAAGVT